MPKSPLCHEIKLPGYPSLSCDMASTCMQRWDQLESELGQTTNPTHQELNSHYRTEENEHKSITTRGLNFHIPANNASSKYGQPAPLFEANSGATIDSGVRTRTGLGLNKTSPNIPQFRERQLVQTLAGPNTGIVSLSHNNWKCNILVLSGQVLQEYHVHTPRPGKIYLCRAPP
jgi:hypothetical protein